LKVGEKNLMPRVFGKALERMIKFSQALGEGIRKEEVSTSQGNYKHGLMIIAMSNEE
jgi:hypothetical protein